MAKLDGKVALITGAARGQGRTHALTLAREGADIVALDIGGQPLGHPAYPVASADDLDETSRLVEDLDRRCLAITADVSSDDDMKAALERAVSEFGRLDVVVANAGIADKIAPFWEITREDWDGLLAINLTGVWLTCKYAAPRMIAQGSGGSIILMSSVAGIKGLAGLAHYNASKFAVRGLAKTFANELGEHGIRVNSIHPGTVDTPMIDAIADMSGATKDEMLKAFTALHIFGQPLEARDISAGILWLASDDSRGATGLELVIDGGWITK
jgi:SDR family mycofactocin-dependent oxidoreductase